MSVAEPRRIVLFRHAKADWPQVSDHERPLAERGRRDAPVAGRKLADSGIAFDLALCSTATRTRETWKLAVQELPQRPKTVYEDRVYEASPGELIAVLNETPDDVQNLVLIGHNPGIQGLTDVLAGSTEGDARERLNRRGFPTAAFAVLTYSGSWKALEPGVATLVDYWAPSE
ncbi:MULTISPECIES: histidine phosphatase family protein [Streptomyces]|uniref:Phosphohistidine phosphatase n=1 Tax=Streptomyces venezuelae TaxID=54571 RepID=A0A5P2B7B0_STRVZ|nr:MULTISPECIES: histidine phosphatase family protein [Streptomyces]NEA02926.1 histidine phosphatase family protein [Streptomyces sp. SID10116]MYY80611.1 histidine phosphatase family protein [Streptomyces sp. SID335]MYZ16359.1 histidine phosphatase family protein [Streptomyces sp. SID337]NDZ85494.1 histidine phosphatase family protein [Streptomyces sp. SID10115]NEB47992.1 histidine phosphatase family protein [Streptomyces sp. SID339]